MIIDDALADLGPRPPGPVVRALGRVFPGIREVQAQTEPYAEAWARANRAALAATGPLWVALGDSMSQGIGASAYDRGWVGQLSTRLRERGWEHRLLNLSVTGARVDDLVETQLPALEAAVQDAGPAALVTVVIGSNDVVSPRHRRDLADRFAAMLDRLPDGAVVMNLPNPHREARRVDALLHDREALGRVVVADMRTQGPRSWRGLLVPGLVPPERPRLRGDGRRGRERPPARRPTGAAGAGRP